MLLSKSMPRCPVCWWGVTFGYLICWLVLVDFTNNIKNGISCSDWPYNLTGITSKLNRKIKQETICMYVIGERICVCQYWVFRYVSLYVFLWAWLLETRKLTYGNIVMHENHWALASYRSGNTIRSAEWPAKVISRSSLIVPIERPYTSLSVYHSKYSSIMYYFQITWRWRIVTLKFRIKVTQGHWKWHHWIDRIRVPICLPL